MVVDQIQYYFHSQFVGAVHELFQVGFRPVFGIYFKIILYPVRIARVVRVALFLAGAPKLPVLVGVGLDYRHEVHAADSRVREVPEPLGSRRKRALLRKGAQGNLAYHGFSQPFRRLARGKIGNFFGGAGRCGELRRQKQCAKEFFHIHIPENIRRRNRSKKLWAIF